MPFWIMTISVFQRQFLSPKTENAEFLLRIGVVECPGFYHFQFPEQLQVLSTGTYFFLQRICQFLEFFRSTHGQFWVEFHAVNYKLTIQHSRN
jgi:hypothetical protein